MITELETIILSAAQTIYETVIALYPHGFDYADCNSIGIFIGKTAPISKEKLNLTLYVKDAVISKVLMKTKIDDYSTIKNGDRK